MAACTGHAAGIARAYFVRVMPDVAVSRLLTVDPDAAALSTDAKAAVAIAMQPQLESTVSHLAEIQQLSDTAVNPESLAGMQGDGWFWYSVVTGVSCS